jgi:hypothetical protein
VFQAPVQASDESSEDDAPKSKAAKPKAKSKGKVG